MSQGKRIGSRDGTAAWGRAGSLFGKLQCCPPIPIRVRAIPPCSTEWVRSGAGLPSHQSEGDPPPVRALSESLHSPRKVI